MALAVLSAAGGSGRAADGYLGGKLSVFQRVPHWVAPFEQFGADVPADLQALTDAVPLYRNWYRIRWGWTFNDRLYSALQKDPQWEHPERSVNAAKSGSCQTPV